MFIGLNPSKGGKNNDRTLNVLEKIILDNGNYGGFYIGNLFAWVAPEPYEMKRSKKPIGDENDKHLVEMAKKCKTIICMWGNDGGLYGRDKDVVELLSKHYPDKILYCFGTTNDGNPIHPRFPRSKDDPYDLGKIEKFTLPKKSYLFNM